MKCARCSGSMVYENYDGIEDQYAWGYKAFKCLHCGDVVDPIILANRRRFKSPCRKAA